MKILAVLALAALLPVSASAKDLTEEERRVEQVYEVPDYKRDQIYSGARMWIAENFKSAKAVIEYENKDEGTIIGNGNIPYPCRGMECMIKPDWRVPFTMRVETKDGRFRLTFTNINLAWPPSPNARAADIPVRKKSDIEKIRPKLLEMGESIKSAIEKGRSSDDW